MYSEYARPVELWGIPKDKRVDFLKRKAAGKGVESITLHKLRELRKHFDKAKTVLMPGVNRLECYVCDSPAKHRHHVMPLNKDGSNSRENLVPLCHKCHELVHCRKFGTIKTPDQKKQNTKLKKIAKREKFANSREKNDFYMKQQAKRLQRAERKRLAKIRPGTALSSFSGVVAVATA